MTRNTPFAVLLLAALCVLAAPAARAAEAQRTITISTRGGDSHQRLTLAQDKAAIVQLDADAKDVLVSNPDIVDAVVRTPRRIFLLASKVGQTNAFFFDSNGKQILSLDIRVEKDVIDLNGLRQILWPVHCVQGTTGAEFAPGLDVARITKVFQKGTDPAIDSYSGFFDNGHRKSTGLGDYLLSHHVSQVLVMGLATDYCVKFTALDSIQRLGFSTYVIRDGSRGVNLQPGDTDRAYEELAANKVGVCHSYELPWER